MLVLFDEKGLVVAIAAEELERLLRVHFPDALIELKDLVGDADHFSLRMVDQRFAGQSRLKRHQMVYEALNGLVGGQLHALSITALSPDDVASF